MLVGCDKYPNKSYYPNGNLQLECEDKDIAECKLYYETGILKQVFVGSEDGMVNGICKLYTEQGKISKKYYIKNGKLDGHSQSFHSTGQVAFSGNYRNDKEEGKHSIFYMDGKIMSTTIYKGGLKQGEAYFFDKESNIEKYQFFVNDSLRCTVEFDEEGKITKERRYMPLNISSDTVNLNDALVFKASIFGRLFNRKASIRLSKPKSMQQPIAKEQANIYFQMRDSLSGEYIIEPTDTGWFGIFIELHMIDSEGEEKNIVGQRVTYYVK